ncbi:MAG: pyridoxal-phosphate dependent enzyme [Salinivirgaceae bacterium]
MKETQKFHLRCEKCQYAVSDFKEWFGNMQKCPKCGHKVVYAEYSKDISAVKDLIDEKNGKAESVFHYFDFLPLNNKENIITAGEGVIPVEVWDFLADFAKKHYNLDIEVWAYRNDKNPGTGTFKDVAASVAASVLKENGVKEYAVASTGNIANAFAHYLAKAGISLSVFIPQDALKANEAEVNTYGQRVNRVKGDYAKAKEIAAAYSEKHGILLSGGNTDPMRVEAKKTMVFEWLRQMKKLPDVYVQALSGGTGPIAIDKAVEDLKGSGIEAKLPRFIMVQPDQCAPMRMAWDDAKAKNFPEGWENDYPKLENPVTKVPTLATGKPGTYPIIGKLTKKSNGEIIEFGEHMIADISRLIAYVKHIQVGPASAIAIGGFFESLHRGIIKNGETVMINVGEGVRRSPEFMEEMIYTTRNVSSIDEVERFDRNMYAEQVWKPFINYKK